MSLTITLCLMLISTGMDVETPEEFLATLSSCSADQWIEYQYLSENAIHPDTVKARIESLRSLSIEPGERILEDIEGGYKVTFPESRWTWRMDGGRIGSVRGESVVEWHPGGYSWAAIPIFSDEGASIGRKESLCMGATMMAVIAVIGILAVWYAKRRYG